MKVRTCDLILYREHRINILKDKIKETEDAYAQAKAIYDNKRLNKFFGWKYEDSIAGSKSWESSWWMWGVYEDKLKEQIVDLKRCRYMVKTGQTIIDFNDRWTDGFFLFCDENSIPY